MNRLLHASFGAAILLVFAFLLGSADEPTTPIVQVLPRTDTARASESSLTPEQKLARIEVRRESHQGSYDRARFKHWTDADSDCEDTRAEVLIDESMIRPTKNGSCTIQTGRWYSLYDGQTTTTASSLDVDHVVPLAEAWRSGAWDWTASRREAFANDLRHPAALRAVTASTNRSKGDRDPSEWLPPRRASWCRYAREWIHVKYVWKLSAQRSEVRALEDVLARC